MKTTFYLSKLIAVLLLFIGALCYSCTSGESKNKGIEAGDLAELDQEEIKLGIIPLTDCAPLVIAFEKGLFKKYGLNVSISKEASWANVRDKILTGELQGAHCLFGMPFSVYTGVSGNAGSEMPIAMLLNNNGQGITLSKEFCGKVKHKSLDGISKAVQELTAKREVVFAGTYPGGTHDTWLRYWLAASGVDQDK
ncbi:MAG: ABC transporter substrate-binding protein, partial [Bacteroidota bacterium]|nr:ABC transporter substrate-binding protein [Bacteroidota bacterium]